MSSATFAVKSQKTSLKLSTHSQTPKPLREVVLKTSLFTTQQPPLTMADHDFFAKKIDLVNIRKIIQHLENLICEKKVSFLLSSLRSLMTPRAVTNASESQRMVQEISLAAQALSVKNGSLIDSAKHIPWDFLRDFSGIIQNEQALPSAIPDLIKLQNALKDLVHSEEDANPELKENTANKKAQLFAHMLGHKSKNDANLKNAPLATQYENILFSGVNRNGFNDLLVLPVLEKYAYVYYHNKITARLSDLSKTIQSIQTVESEKNAECLLSIVALAGELAKIFLAFKRYIPIEHRAVFKDIKSVRNAIEHMIDYEKTTLFLAEKSKDFSFLTALSNLFLKFKNALLSLPKSPQQQKSKPHEKKVLMANGFMDVLLISLPDDFHVDEQFKNKLNIIKNTLLGEYEFEHSDTSFRKIYGENLVNLLKHNCPELLHWQGVSQSLLEKMEGVGKKFAKDFQKPLTQKINALYEKISPLPEPHQTVDEKIKKIEIEMSKLQADKSAKKEFDDIKKDMRHIKSKIASVKKTFQSAQETYQKKLSFKQKVKKHEFCDIEISKFCDEYKKALDENGKKTSDLQTNFIS